MSIKKFFASISLFAKLLFTSVISLFNISILLIARPIALATHIITFLNSTIHDTHTHIFSPLLIVMLLPLCTLHNQIKSIWDIRKSKKTFTLMLNPAGDAQNPGRLIDDNFERSVTFSYGQKLKDTIEQTYPQISVVLTRYPGEKIPELQNANFANRLDADLFLSIHFYQETDVKPHMFMYEFCYQPHLQEKPTDFSFYSYDKAYLFAQQDSQAWAQKLYTTCSQEPFANFFTTHKPIKLPCEPLIGIKVPAIMLEFGIKNKNDWRTYIKPIIQAIIEKLNIQA